MSSVALLVLLWGVCAVNAEINSLTYVYTAFTRPVNLPGIHEFSAMGLLDGRPIDYFDSTTQVKVPREPWMKERLEQDYWDKGTSSRKTKQQWFKVNLNILTTRLMKNNTDNHVLQWRHGCNIKTDGSKKTVTGTDQYSYDGDDFLSFDSDNKQWVAPMSEAVQTKRKWDGIQQLNDYTEGYLHNECVQWLETFLKYRKEAAQKASPPEVYVYAKPVKNNLKLTCMATGFYPKEISVYIRRDVHLVDRFDGLQSTGVRPNGDGTHQIKMWVMIPKSDTAKYTCEVNHPATGIVVVREWDHQVESDESNTGFVAGVVGVVLVLLVAISTGVAIFIIRKRRATENSSSNVVAVQNASGQHGVNQALLTVVAVQNASGQHGVNQALLTDPEPDTGSVTDSGIIAGSNTGSNAGSNAGSSSGSNSSLGKPDKLSVPTPPTD